MNEVLVQRKVSATAVVVGFNAALAIGANSWPTVEPVYVTNQSKPTFSFFERTLLIAPSTASDDFLKEISSVFASLTKDQKPLGPEFEAVWDANVASLYQS